MALATWWSSDTLPFLNETSAFKAAPSQDDRLLAKLNRISLAEVHQRRDQGHRPYLAYWQGEPAAYGWVATHTAEIGELDLRFNLPAQDRYLWDFATLPQWRGRGIYPRLLQAILQQEAQARFWIIFAPENLPSGAGIYKAGFTAVGQLSFTLHDGRVALAGNSRRIETGAMVLGIPVTHAAVLPCWACAHQAGCGCAYDILACTCAVQVA